MGLIYASMMLRRDAQQTIGLFDENLKRGEDFEYITRAIGLGISVGNSSHRHYAYRHPRFDSYTKFRSDNVIRGVGNLLLLRYLINTIYRAINLPLDRKIRKEWEDIFDQTSQLIKTQDIFVNYLAD